MDLGVGPRFELKTVPKGSLPLKHHLAPARHGHIISVETGAFSAGIQKATGLPDGIALAGLNVQGLSCDLHALLNSSYPRPSSTSKDLSLFAFCNWALANFGSAAEVRAALEAEQVVSWVSDTEQLLYCCDIAQARLPLAVQRPALLSRRRGRVQRRGGLMGGGASG